MAITAPRRVLAIAALVTIAAGVFGMPVAKTLCACGFEDHSSESAAAAELLTDKFDAGDAQLVFVVTAPDGYGSGPGRAVGTEIVDQLARSQHVALLNMVSLTAAFGSMVWIFQDGGIARTGRVVTAAALVMSISFAALIAAQVSFMQMFGLGLTLAILADATLVRMVLLPAFMHVMGERNWWSPRWLTKLHDRIGIDDGGPRMTGESVLNAPRPVNECGSGHVSRETRSVT